MNYELLRDLIIRASMEQQKEDYQIGISKPFIITKDHIYRSNRKPKNKNALILSSSDLSYMTVEQLQEELFLALNKE